jgi:Ca-activated chloride channel family protein
MWARRRIDEIELGATLGDLDQRRGAELIGRLGLDFGLVTRETSLIAVDRTPSRPRGAPLRREDIPLNLPAGWDVDAWFAANPAGSGQALVKDQLEALGLPQTATEAAALMRTGAILLLLGLAGLVALRRRNAACA